MRVLCSQTKTGPFPDMFDLTTGHDPIAPRSVCHNLRSKAKDRMLAFKTF